MKQITPHNQFSKYPIIWYIAIVVAGAMMIAHGMRMMYQGLFQPGSVYPAPLPTGIDFWFDWMLLAVFGCIIFIYGLHHFYNKKHLEQMHVSQEIIEPCIT